VGGAALALGLAAEAAAFGWNEAGKWLPDLVTGWTLAGCGIAAWWRRPDSRVGPLLAAAGVAWFAGNFAGSGVPVVAWLGAQLIYLYRGPLVHALVAYPTGRASGLAGRAVVAGGYAAAAVASVWAGSAATVALSALLVLAAVRARARSYGPMRRARRMSVWASAALGLALAGQALVRLADPSAGANGATLLAVEAAICCASVLLLAGLLSTSWKRASVADLVVELGEGRSATLRDELAHALADPTLEVGYWLPGPRRFVDAAGEAVALPEGSDRSMTVVRWEGEPVAALVHQPAVLDDPGLVQAVTTATRLSAWNAGLQAEVREQVAGLRRSRRRILEAGDDERRRLERRLHGGAEARLVELGTTLQRAAESASGDRSSERIRRAQLQLERTLAELRDLAHGLHPRDLAERGLDGAVSSLAGRASVPVSVRIDAPRLPPEIESTVYFVCSEALANVEKYAAAGEARIAVAVGGGLLRVVIADDGAGGAEPGRGSGLRGLADRVEALGGTFELESPSGGGTRVVAEIPL